MKFRKIQFHGMKYDKAHPIPYGIRIEFGPYEEKGNELKYIFNIGVSFGKFSYSFGFTLRRHVPKLVVAESK
jgi:hypothetical protein